MVSSFDEFNVMLQEHPFEILTLSETCLKDDVNLLKYVQIPGYKFSTRTKMKEEERVSDSVSKIQLNTRS